ncbi:MAG: hypothetical protein PHH60_03840, partial [Candidatus Margulisbacteria bacterium]|nr:hypothetical protein [Candidatus Margulisiibacteriota bacterium]
MRVSAVDNNKFSRPYLKLRWSGINFKFIRPVFIAATNSLSFLPKPILDTMRIGAFLHVPRGENMSEAVPLFRNVEELAAQA